MSKKIMLVLFALTLFFAGAGRGFAQEAAKAMKPEQAIVAGDHAALATYYKAQAEAQRQVAELHDKMKVSYRSSHVHYKGSENALAAHCGELKFQALKMAEKYDAMAKEEEKLASQPSR